MTGSRPKNTEQLGSNHEAYTSSKTAVLLDRLRTALDERYHIERELGRGGMAVVYLAEDIKHHRRVALKVLRPELTAVLGAQRFLTEIEITARLNNPHILPLHDSGEAAGLLFYVMPYVEGESLRARLDREKQLPIEDALEIARDVAAALSYAHSHGLIHRDIKPENILLSAGEAVVADFGIAQAVSVAGAERLTETGMTMGTPAYMSPEQAMGERELEARSDIYALGCVLYEMLAGQPPLVGATAQATMARRLSETPAPLRAVRDTVPAELEQAVRKALARVPADRFISAQQLAEALRVCEAYVPPVRGVPRRKATRALLALGALAALAVIGALLLRSPSRPDLDPNLLVVAPFDVLDPELGLWREGLVDLLSASLDGAGPLRAAPPSAVVKLWEGRADALSASRLAGGLGAGLAVFGRIVQAGEDSVRLSTSLFDVSAGRALAEFEFRGTASRIDGLADSLALRVLAEVSRARRLAGERLSSLGSRSPAAIKAFLQGEQHLRRMSLDSAELHYQRAIDQDSTFVLALNKMGLALAWNGKEEVGREHTLRAGSLNRGLAPRESLLVAADSLFASLQGWEQVFRGDSASWSRLARLFTTLERATELYPKDVGAWYRLGEARAHWGTSTGVTSQQRLLPFARAMELDSGFAPAYLHLAELTLEVHGVEAGRRLMTALANSNPTGQARSFRLTSALLDPLQDAAPQAVLRAKSLSAADWLEIVSLLFYVADSAETVIHAAKEAVRQSTGSDDFAAVQLAFARALRGHPGEARQEQLPLYPESRDLVFYPFLFSELALLGSVPRDTAAAVFTTWLADQKFTHMALAWWYAVGDTLFLARAERAATSSRGELPMGDRAFLGYTRDVARAYLALARGDSTEALRRFAALPPWPCLACYRERLMRARLLAASGKLDEAAVLLDAEPRLSVPRHPGHVLWVLERARVREQLGHQKQAIAAYSYVADVWRHADPELQPVVREARAALARLTMEPQQ
jgi:eukaryotic-like serine/threonine-protein kinase